MKTISLFQVYDSVGETMITQAIPSTNKLTAALGFFNTYIKEKDKQRNPFDFRQLDLHCVAVFDLDDDGMWKNPKSSDWVCSGQDIKSFISAEMASRGIDDFFDVEDVEE